MPTHHSLHQYPPLECCICYNLWIYADISSSLKSIVYIRVRSWWWTFYGLWQTCDRTYSQLYYRTGHFHCPKKSPVIHLVILTPNPWQPLICLLGLFLKNRSLTLAMHCVSVILPRMHPGCFRKGAGIVSAHFKATANAPCLCYNLPDITDFLCEYSHSAVFHFFLP